jgi:O-antigen ligase
MVKAGLRRIAPDFWLPLWTRGLLLAAGAALGLILARLPLLWAVIGLLVAILLVLTLIEPLVGLGVTLLFATFKPLTDYFVPQLPLDIGQIALLVTLGSWLLKSLRLRQARIPASPLTIPLLIFIGAASLSIPGALSIGYAAKELIKWLQLALLMWLVISEAGSRRWQVVLAMVLGAAALEAVIGAWQFGIRGVGPKEFLILGDKFYRAYGTFEQPNPYGGFIGLTLPLAVGLLIGAITLWLGALKDDWRTKRFQRWSNWLPIPANRHLGRMILFGVLVLLLLAALIMSWSRGAWLGFGAVIVVLLFAAPRRVGLGMLLIVVGIGGALLGARYHLLPDAVASRLTAFTEFTQSFDVRGVDITPDNYAVVERLAHWQAAEEMARYHLLVGVGLGNYEPVYPGFRLVNWSFPLGHAHNIYLNMLAETGIIGLLAYLGLWAGVFWQTWRVTRSSDPWRRAAGLGLLGVWTALSVHQLVDNLYVANIPLHLGALLGVLSILICCEREAKQTVERNH